jgi:CheY-like chemotaxis protein
MGNVLIVEDDALLVKVYSTRLKAGGHQVFSAKDGVEGLKLAQEKKPQVILLDIMMPKMSGLDVLAHLKKDPSTASIPVLVYSNLGKDKEIEEAKKLGAAEFLTKASCTPQEVVEKIESYIKQIANKS